MSPWADGTTTGRTAAAFEQIVVGRRLSVVAYGATGDGSTDDSAAIQAAVAALTDGDTLYFPSGTYRYADGSPAGAGYAAVRIDGLSDITVLFDPGAVLLMDNLDGGGEGTTNGILIVGSCSNVLVVGATVKWADVPSARSTGEAFRFYGFPSDSPPPVGHTNSTGPVTNVQLIDCTAVNCPQTGAIFMGCSDVKVKNFRVDSSLADGLHFNACRRVEVDGYTAVDTGDDGLAFVTYYDAAGPAAAYNWGPFALPSLSDWSNHSCSATNIVVDGGDANGVRLSAVHHLTLTNVAVNSKASSGVIIDAGIADDVSYFWTYLASRGVAVSNVTVDGCDTGLLVETYNCDSGDSDAYWRFDATISNVVSRDHANRPVRFQGDPTADGLIAGVALNGFRGYASTNKAASFVGVRDCVIRDVYNQGTIQVYGSDGFSDAMSALPVNDVVVSGLFADGGSISFQALRSAMVDGVRSASSSTDGLLLKECLDVLVNGVTVVNAHRGNTGTSAAVALRKAQHVHVSNVAVTHDTNNTGTWSVIEVGGGDATDVSFDVTVDPVVYRSGLNSTDSGVTFQGGSYPPYDCLYDVRFYHSAAASPLWVRERYGYTTWVEHFIQSWDPEGDTPAPPGSTCQRDGGGTGTSFYVKESGTGDTGWVAK